MKISLARFLGIINKTVKIEEIGSKLQRLWPHWPSEVEDIALPLRGTISSKWLC